VAEGENGGVQPTHCQLSAVDMTGIEYTHFMYSMTAQPRKMHLAAQQQQQQHLNGEVISAVKSFIVLKLLRPPYVRK